MFCPPAGANYQSFQAPAHGLKDIINNLKKSDTQKIQLTIANKFISFIDNDEEHAMHSKSDNVEIMINDEADEVIKDFLIDLKIDIKMIYNR